MSAAAHPYLTPEQYLEIERKAETRSEYYNGRMYAMSGGAFRHVQIISNFAAELHDRLRGKPCDVLSSDMRTVAAGIYTYPDIVITCDEPRFAHGQKDTLLNPTIVIEVLSPSTEAYDRGMKSAHYRRVESLREYAIVSQIEPRVEVFRRQTNGDWVMSEYIGLDAVCRFESVDCAVPLSEIYRRVVFNAEERAAIPRREAAD